VVSGSDLKEQQYRSPVRIRAFLPLDRRLAGRAVVRIMRDRFKPKVMPLANIADGEMLRVNLEKEFRLRFRMTGREKSDELRIRDKAVSLVLRIDEQRMMMSLTNRTSRVMNVLWQRASYTDVNNRIHRIMHPGIRYEDRYGSFPLQQVMPYVTLHQAVIPVDNVALDPEKKAFEILPLFRNPLNKLGGKELKVVIPIEIESRIVPYTFRVKVDVM
jgi:hypothetical protein